MSDPMSDPWLLRTDRLGFRTWSLADLELAQELWGDPAVTRWIGGPFSPAGVEERLRLEIATQASDGIQYWPVFLLASGEHVGCCGLRPYEAENAILELGFHIRSAHWRHGYAAEAARAVIRTAFERLGARALFAGHHPDNDASRRLLEKLGFRYTHDEMYPPTGKRHPSYRLERGSPGRR